MKFALRIVSLFGFLFSMSAQGSDCDPNGISLEKLQPSAMVNYIKERFSASDYSCAIYATQLGAASASRSPGMDGFDARFALREMALDLARDTSFPSDERVALLRAAAISQASKAQVKEDLQADVRMFLYASKVFQSQKDGSEALDMMAISIRLDQKLPDTDRRIDVEEVTKPPEIGAYKYIEQLATLAELVRNDKKLATYRTNLAFTGYYDSVAWRQDDSAPVILERCKQLLRFTNALNDVKTCFTCGPDWRWKPLAEVAVAYYRLGMPEDATKYIDQSIQIMRGIQNPDERLGQYRLALNELLAAKYDPNAIRSLAKEIVEFSNSLDTPLAKDLRVEVPGILQHWKVDYP